MDVKIALHAGFCMGVDLALKKLDQAINNSRLKKSKVATIGPVIHNPQVLIEYKEKGVEVFNTLEEILNLENKETLCLVIRAHGIPKEDEEKLKNENITMIDATCPKVKAAQLAVYKATLKAKEIIEKDNFSNSVLLLYGEKEHPEVQGIISYSQIPYIVFSDPSSVLETIHKLPKNYILAAQTTQDMEIYINFSNKLQEIAEKLHGKLHVLHTICDATQKRQEAVRELAELENSNKVEAFIVVGGKTSGNTRRLAEISQSYNLPTYHVETASELDIEKLKDFKVVGLTAGASTPNKYIDEVKNKLEKL